MAEEEKQNPLKIISVFSHTEKIFGLPSNVFIYGAGIGATIFFFLSKVMGVIFIGFYFYLMFEIHKDDPKAFDVWLIAIRDSIAHKAGWSASKFKTTKIVVIDSEK